MIDNNILMMESAGLNALMQWLIDSGTPINEVQIYEFPHLSKRQVAVCGIQIAEFWHGFDSEAVSFQVKYTVPDGAKGPVSHAMSEYIRERVMT